MWYVMQVVSGKEGQTVFMMEKILSKGILETCFVPMRRMKKKYHGKWREITEKLFPGYVFLISGRPQLLYDELKNIPVLTKLLGNCEEYFTPLSETDLRFLGKLQGMQNKKNIPQDKQNVWSVQLSKVIVGEDRQLRVISGPLKDFEGQILKMNLHKRIAIVEMEFMGNKTSIHLGIEIVNK